jgi:hypothetical protein
MRITRAKPDQSILRREAGGMFRGESQGEIEAESYVGTTEAAEIVSGSVEADGQAVTQSDNSPVAQNDDILEQKIRRPWLTRSELKSRRRARKLWYKAWRAITREKTAEELQLDEENAERKRLKATHLEGAKRTSYILQRELTRMGFRYETSLGEGRRRVDEVKFSIIYYSPLAYLFGVGHLPYNVDTIEMTSEKTCTNLSRAVGHNVRAYMQPSFGLVYMVEVGSTMGIPDLVKFNEMHAAFPKNLPDLAFPVGVTSNGTRVYDSFEKRLHLLVAGKSGGGKSNQMNVILSSILMRNGPDRVQFVMVDMKGGVELDFYNGIPHLIHVPDTPTPIIEKAEHAMIALDWLINEGERRQRLIKKAKVKSIKDYNRNKTAAKRIHSIMLVVDELAVLSLSKYRTDAEEKLTRIANEFRASGFHIFIATQYPNSKVLTTQISVNIDTRMAFAMSQHASQTVLGSWDAFKLSPAGRMYYMAGDRGMFVQAPYITDSTVKSVVARAKGESEEVVMNSLDIEKVLTWALENLNGHLSRDPLFAQFKELITLVELNEMLTAAEGKTFVLNETSYKISPAAGRKPRLMVKVKENQ